MIKKRHHEPIRVLHVITTINRGGSENQLYELVLSQKRQGLEPSVAYLKGDSYWGQAFRKNGVNATNLGLRYYVQAKPVFALRRLIRTSRPHLIHAHMPPAELYTRLALLFDFPEAQMLITKHNDEPFYRGVGQSVLGRWVARRASHVIAISNAVKAYTHEHLRIPNKKITTIYYGIDHQAYTEPGSGLRASLRSQWGLSPKHYVIGSVGRMVPQKAQHVLIEQYAKYCTTERMDSRLVIAGRGNLEPQLKNRARKLGIEQKIIWIGFREDIPAVMQAFDVFALTSAYEGFGLVLLEAMAAGRPVVATRVSAIPEIVQDGVTGILCDRNVPREFANAFLRLENQALRENLGSAGRKRVERDFDTSHTAKATKALYEACLS